MNKGISAPIAIGIVVVVLLLLVGYFVYASTNNGESRNPNVGKPSKKGGHGMSRSAADNMDEDTYMKFLKQNRPDLSDAEIKTKADLWWKIKSGQAAPSTN